MKNTLKVSLLVLISLSLNSCLDLDPNKKEDLSIATDFTPVEVNGDYSIGVPKYMKATNDLNDEASLQYQNIFKETYLVIIDEPKEPFVTAFQELGEYNDSISIVKNYRDIQLLYLSEAIDIKRKTDSKSVKVNGLDAEIIEIDGSVEGVASDIFYYLAFVEDDKNVYMIMVWTLKDRKEKYRSTFKQIVESFRQL